MNFNLGQRFNAPVNLRFDDTNPAKESIEYVNAIKSDIQWLGYQWAEERYASDYFDQLFAWAQELISKGLAYVDSKVLKTWQFKKEPQHRREPTVLFEIRFGDQYEAFSKKWPMENTKRAARSTCKNRYGLSQYVIPRSSHL